MACGATLKRSLEFDPLHSPSTRSPKRRRCIPMTVSPSTPATSSSQNNSPFGEVLPRITSEQIAANISAEIKRIQRRKALQYPNSPSPPMPSSSPPPVDMTGVADSVTSQQKLFGALSPSKKDAPIFTFRQVGMVCERLLKEREQQIKEEYDKVLNCKLAEQYEAFLKFNHDQIHKRFSESSASYVS